MVVVSSSDLGFQAQVQWRPWILRCVFVLVLDLICRTVATPSVHKEISKDARVLKRKETLVLKGIF